MDKGNGLHPVLLLLRAVFLEEVPVLGLEGARLRHEVLHYPIVHAGAGTVVHKVRHGFRVALVAPGLYLLLCARQFGPHGGGRFIKINLTFARESAILTTASFEDRHA